MNLQQLAKVILSIESNGLSKVRFAKTIYFVHKELIRCDAMQATDIDYIRMPLGPVPNGFMELAFSNNDIVTEILQTGLSYNSVNYKLRKRRLFRSGVEHNDLYRMIKSILENLRSLSTGTLVEKSHDEHSWKLHKNGEHYNIDSRDMRNAIPTGGKGYSSVVENQKIQASLVMGMLEDIVSESTDLEHPSDEQNEG